MSTIPEERVAVLVVVAPSEELLAACRESVRYLIATTLEVTDVKSMATDIATWRPFVIVIEEDLFAFDPGEFIALARDVTAEVVTVPGSARRDELIAILLPRLKTAFRRWYTADVSC